jgi:hypothetical protein
MTSKVCKGALKKPKVYCLYADRNFTISKFSFSSSLRLALTKVESFNACMD